MKETTTKLSQIYFFANFETDFADIESHIAVFEKMSCRFRTQKHTGSWVGPLLYLCNTVPDIPIPNVPIPNVPENNTKKRA